jgi:hypothetical protein
VAGLDQVPGQQAAATAELDDHAAARSNELEQREDAGRAQVGVEPEPEMVHEGEIPPVVRIACCHSRIMARPRIDGQVLT